MIGRDKLIGNIWKRLEKGSSLRFTAERRIGKTSVMQKMRAEPKEGFRLVYLDIEGTETPEYFVEKLLQGLRDNLTGPQKAKRMFKGLHKSLGGTEIAGMIKLPTAENDVWQPALEKILEEVCGNFPDQRIVLMLDELPYMLQKMDDLARKTGKPSPALHILDVLRELRHKHANLHMIYCGSVGLHHVVTQLRSPGLSSEPVNDMPLMEIHPLEPKDALLLADRLFEEEGIETTEERKPVLAALVKETDGFPFYMERVAERLAESGLTIGKEQVGEMVRCQLASGHDPWQMEHFRSRLSDYYPGEMKDVHKGAVSRRDFAVKILDALTLSEHPMSIEEIQSTVKTSFSIEDRGVIVEMLRLLELDHYLIADEEKRYTFRFTLVKRWWKIAQGLES
ncbi:MAG: hypothetical protein JJU05_07275 [Verrucomicrobia bacterium]|nr:hypothetical protein [Verrucomicrobiota bacterium]